MIGRPEYTLTLPLPFSTNRDHLTRTGCRTAKVVFCTTHSTQKKSGTSPTPHDGSRRS